MTDVSAVVARGEVSCLYQPVFDLRTGDVLGFEALARGPGNSPPGPLFEAAEESGLLLEVDRLCLQKAFESALPGMLFVNVVGRNVPFLELPEAPAHVNRVVVEVGEKGVLDLPRLKPVLERWREERGILVAVDDVGSGHDRLSALAELSPEYVKVARGLVRGCAGSAARRGVLGWLAALAENLGAAVVAEGLERPEDLAAVKELGIRYGQGFLLGRPARGADLSRGLSRSLKGVAR